MKVYRPCWIIVMAAALAIVGCKRDEGGSVDTSRLEKSFASAEAAAKSGVDKAVAAIKSADYAGAIAELKSLGQKAKLTPEQEQAIKDVMTRLEQFAADAAKKAGEMATKAADEAGKAVGELQKSLNK